MNIILSMKQTVEYPVEKELILTKLDILILAQCGKEPLGTGIG